MNYDFKRKCLGLVLAFALIIPSVSFGQSIELTLDEAIDIAIRSNYSIKVAELDVKRAEADVSEAYGFALPTINLSSNYTRNIEPPSFFFDGFGDFGKDTNSPFPVSNDPIKIAKSNAYDAKIEIRQTIFNSAVFKGISAADVYSDAAREQMNNNTSKVVLNVKNAYYTVLLAKEALELIETSLQNAQKNYEDVSILFREGLISEYDLIRAEVYLENIRPEKIKTEYNLKDSKNALKVVLGMDPSQEITIKDSFENKVNSRIDLNKEELEKSLVQNNNDLKVIEKQKAVNKDFISINESEYLPTLSLFGNYSLQGQADDFNFQNVSSSAVGISFSMSLFQGFQTNAKVEKAEIDLEKTSHQESLVKISLKSQLSNIVSRIETAQKQIESNEKTIKQAERGYEISKVRYTEGIGSQLEINDADLALRTAKLNKMQSIYNYLVANAELDQILGKGK